MNQKVELVRENLQTSVTVTRSELLVGALLCFLAGVVFGWITGMAGKGINTRVSIGSNNGSQNSNNGNGNGKTFLEK